MHCRVWSGILWPLPTRCQQHLPVMTTTNVPRHCPVSRGAVNLFVRLSHVLALSRPGMFLLPSLGIPRAHTTPICHNPPHCSRLSSNASPSKKPPCLPSARPSTQVTWFSLEMLPTVTLISGSSFCGHPL